MYVGKPTGTNIGINFHKTDSTLGVSNSKVQNRISYKRIIIYIFCFHAGKNSRGLKNAVLPHRWVPKIKWVSINYKTICPIQGILFYKTLSTNSLQEPILLIWNTVAIHPPRYRQGALTEECSNGTTNHLWVGWLPIQPRPEQRHKIRLHKADNMTSFHFIIVLWLLFYDDEKNSEVLESKTSWKADPSSLSVYIRSESKSYGIFALRRPAQSHSPSF